MTLTLNLNHIVTVDLTPYGLYQLDRHEESLGIPERHRRLSLRGDEWRGPLWELMSIFGSEMCNGMATIPFKGNNIRL